MNKTIYSTTQGFQGQRHDLENGDTIYRYRNVDGAFHDVRIPRDDLKRLYTVGELVDYVFDAIENGRSEIVEL